MSFNGKRCYRVPIQLCAAGHLLGARVEAGARNCTPKYGNQRLWSMSAPTIAVLEAVLCVTKLKEANALAERVTTVSVDTA